jgi:hypothetical protein
VRDDDGGTAQAVNQVTVNSASVNNAPLAAADAYSTQAGQPLIVNASQGVLANDSDPDGDPLISELITPPGQGLVMLNSDGSFTYSPGTAVSGATDTFTYHASDGSLTSTATVTITLQ